MSLADEVASLSCGIQKLSDAVANWVISSFSQGTFRSTPFSEWNRFDKLCSVMSSHMTMEQIARFALTGKVIQSYKIDSANSFYDQLTKGLWKKVSNGGLYKLDDCEKFLYVEMNDNFEVESENCMEKLRNFNVAHKVFDEMTKPVLCLNKSQSVSFVDGNATICENDRVKSVDVVEVGVNKIFERDVDENVDHEVTQEYDTETKDAHETKVEESCLLVDDLQDVIKFARESCDKMRVPDFMLEMAQATLDEPINRDEDVVSCEINMKLDDFFVYEQHMLPKLVCMKSKYKNFDPEIDMNKLVLLHNLTFEGNDSFEDMKNVWQPHISYKEVHSWGILDMGLSFCNELGVIFELPSFQYDLARSFDGIITYDMLTSHKLDFIGSLPKFKLHYSIYVCRFMTISGACYGKSTEGSDSFSNPTLEDKGDFRGVEDTSKECNWEFNRLVLWFNYITNRTRKGVGFLTYVFDPGGLYWQINVLDGKILDSSKELFGYVLHCIPFMVSLPCVLCAQFREGFDKVYGVNKGQNSNDIFWTKKVTCASQIIVWSVWSGKLILVKHIGRVRIRRTITLMKHVNLELAWKILHDQQLASILKETKLLSLMTEIIKIRARLEWRPGISLENDKQSPNDTIFVFDPGGSHIVKRCLDEPTGSLRTRII